MADLDDLKRELRQVVVTGVAQPLRSQQAADILRLLELDRDDEYVRRKLAMRAAGDERRVRPLSELAVEDPFPLRPGGNVPFHIYNDRPDGHGGKRGRWVATARTAELADLLVEGANAIAREGGLLGA